MLAEDIASLYYEKALVFQRKTSRKT